MTSAELSEDRRTAADIVFDRLHERIVTLDLLPGARMSEVEIAAAFDVSRQPVRDAFSRLGSLGFLRIRPQKATIVKPFSLSAIANARFVRQAIETEIMRHLAQGASEDALAALGADLDRQEAMVAGADIEGFHACDTQFHLSLCRAAGQPAAHAVVQSMKTQIDRLCRLSLGRGREMETLLADHRAIAATIGGGDANAATAAMRVHLNRLDATIEEVARAHSEYFER